MVVLFFVLDIWIFVLIIPPLSLFLYGINDIIQHYIHERYIYQKLHDENNLIIIFKEKLANFEE